ncbi:MULTISPECIES: DUF1304 domain-containing protein [Kocuria]|uniref:DUF1304 domain-containing protein n=1 Tax=Kocuria subflava TaxID=1736139 RepID=A0A846TTQ1_9MICC|nr:MULTISPECIES: DUF1304 domain-containing protein [Kocuria]NKE10380.1 DUF1304 domain-containing protein [Kocuria subflava]
MITLGLILATLAALIHVYIFYLESIAWTGPAARKVFGLSSPELAESTKGLAFNQGFYNLFLAIEIFLGLIFWIAGWHAVGATLVLVGAGSMVAAGLALLLSNRTKTSAALKQLTLPALGILALVIGLLL